jgi:N-glycosylase/DNA lyase
VSPGILELSGFRARGVWFSSPMAARIPVRTFDLAATLGSGQAFHWNAGEDGSFTGCIGERLVRVQADGDGLRVHPEEAAAEVRHYFRLEEDHDAVLASFPSDDPVLAAAVAFCPGLRILRQPLWECLATFLTSSLKQVAHIRDISLRLRRELGSPRELDGGGFRGDAYPSPERIAAAGELRLRELGLGFRARSVHRAATRLAAGDARLEDGEGMDDDALREFLLGFDGVGEKIANCVRLFGYGRLAAFPVDVWIERVLRERYFGGREVSRKELEAFVVHHFGPYGGYAQQYLFHHARTGPRSPRNSRSRP